MPENVNNACLHFLASKKQVLLFYELRQLVKHLIVRMTIQILWRIQYWSKGPVGGGGGGGGGEVKKSDEGAVIG